MKERRRPIPACPPSPRLRAVGAPEAPAPTPEAPVVLNFRTLPYAEAVQRFVMVYEAVICSTAKEHPLPRSFAEVRQDARLLTALATISRPVRPEQGTLRGAPLREWDGNASGTLTLARADVARLVRLVESYPWAAHVSVEVVALADWLAAERDGRTI